MPPHPGAQGSYATQPTCQPPQVELRRSRLDLCGRVSPPAYVNAGSGGREAEPHPAPGLQIDAPEWPGHQGADTGATSQEAGGHTGP